MKTQSDYHKLYFELNPEIQPEKMCNQTMFKLYLLIELEINQELLSCYHS